MKTRNKKVSIIVASALFIYPLLASADMSSSDNNMNMDNTSTSTMPAPVPPMSPIGQWQMMMSGSSLTGSGWQTTSEDRTKIDYIMKSLEAQLKTIRESLTKDNMTEMKQKAIDLQATYKAKIAEAFPDRAADVQKIVDYRFTIFFNNQFKIREQVKEIKDNAKDLVNKAKDAWKEAINRAKEMAKNAIDAAKDAKKTENNQVRTEKKEVKQDLKSQYKAKFIAQLKDKLDNIPVERLQLLVDKLKVKRDEINNNDTISDYKKERYLAQIDALLEILDEKINPTASTDLNLNQIINDTINGWTWTTNTGSTVTQ